jgi:soluble lytic murein transglycosylase
MQSYHRALPIAAALAGLATGLAISTSWSSARLRERLPSVSELARATDLGDLDPLRSITRAELRLIAEKARTDLDRGRPWAAWRALEPFAGERSAEPPLVLLAARAAGEWGGWGHVRDLLRGRPWLNDPDHAEGWMLLGRAEEARGQWDAAAAAYRRSAAMTTGAQRGAAEARMAVALGRGKHPREAAAAFAAAAADLPFAADWFRALQTEALGRAGDPAATSVTGAVYASAPARVRLARAQAAAWIARGDTAQALARLEQETRALAAAPDGAAAAAALLVERARLLLRSAERRADVRELLRQAAADPAAERDLRARAAALLGDLPGVRTAAEELARASAYEAAGKPGLAARSLRAALAAGAPDDPETRLHLGRLLFDAADLIPARTALLDAAARLSDPERVAEAQLYAARALFRADAGAGLAALRKVVDAHAGTAAAGTALFLLGDATGNRETAISLYRRAASVRSSPSAQEALFRLGDRSLKAGDPAGAIRAWEEQVARFPQSEQTAHAAYRAGVLHEQAGRAGRARAMYGAAIAADPISYYAVRAADRMGADPLDYALSEPRPWIGDTSDPADAATALRRLELLEKTGLDDAWKEELDAQLRRLDARPAALLALAEGLRDQGHTIEGIRLGRKLAERRGQRWDGRLLRVVFPFPYRDLLRDEADRAGVDPYLLAALVRQESSFDRFARSRVGATGLSQIMPATGRWLATSARLDEFDPSLLTIPEINLRMGARYLADQVERYHGARDLALAAYNAGPGRADRWKRELGYGGDPDRFREAIPFNETREYVKLVLRNAAVYKRLYGGPRSPGLVTGGD